MYPQIYDDPVHDESPPLPYLPEEEEEEDPALLNMICWATELAFLKDANSILAAFKRVPEAAISPSAFPEKSKEELQQALLYLTVNDINQLLAWIKGSFPRAGCERNLSPADFLTIKSQTSPLYLIWQSLKQVLKLKRLYKEFKETDLYKSIKDTFAYLGRYGLVNP